MARPLRATIHLSALRHNLSVVRRHAPHSRIMVVIKANGYGHGMLRVARALEDADGFAVLTVQEGIALREAGFTQEILLLEGFFGPDELPLLLRHHLSSVVHSAWQLDTLSRFPAAADIPVWLKVNTGMNRLGFQPQDFPGALRNLLEIGAQLTLMTHFACADEEGGIATPLAQFNALTAHAGLPRSMANSAALLTEPQSQADWVRPGIMLYGASPLPGQSPSAELQPAMTLASEIIATRDLRPGEAVGYGATFQAESPMRIGIVACGYADGYPRHAPSGTPVRVKGQLSHTVGRISMDMMCVDLSNIPDTQPGSPVTLWGEGLPVEAVAHAAGTIAYELLCALAQRVPVVEEG